MASGHRRAGWLEFYFRRSVSFLAAFSADASSAKFLGSVEGKASHSRIVAILAFRFDDVFRRRIGRRVHLLERELDPVATWRAGASCGYWIGTFCNWHDRSSVDFRMLAASVSPVGRVAWFGNRGGGNRFANDLVE